MPDYPAGFFILPDYLAGYPAYLAEYPAYPAGHPASGKKYQIRPNQLISIHWGAKYLGLGRILYFLPDSGCPVPAKSGRICRIIRPDIRQNVKSGRMIWLDIRQNEKSGRIIRHCRISGQTLVLNQENQNCLCTGWRNKQIWGRIYHC